MFFLHLLLSEIRIFFTAMAFFFFALLCHQEGRSTPGGNEFEWGTSAPVLWLMVLKYWAKTETQ